ncbi:MAG: hypothetical protein KDD51_09145, partial [Bdellovibrionales bacterium]|nr:hypothetical protein [Bdellovibrionales bacterium]
MLRIARGTSLLFLVIALLVSQGVSLADVENDRTHAPPTGAPPAERPPAAPKQDPPTTTNNAFQEKVEALKKHLKPVDEQGKPVPKVADGDDYDTIKDHSEGLGKALEALQALTGEGSLYDQIKAQIGSEVTDRAADRKDPEEHQALLLGLGKLQETLQGEEAKKILGEFDLATLDTLVTDALGEDNKSEEARTQLSKLASTLRGLTPPPKEGTPEAVAFRAVKDYIADRLVTKVATEFEPESGGNWTDPQFKQAQTFWQQAQSLNPHSYQRNTEVARFFHGRAASGERAAWNPDDTKRTEADSTGKKYQFQVMDLTTPNGGTSQFHVFSDAASGGGLFAVRPEVGVDGYMNGGKGAKVEKLFAVSGTAALETTGRDKDGKLVFEGYQEGNREVKGVYYRRLPETKKADGSPTPNGNAAEVGKIYNQNDGGHHEFASGLYVPAGLTHGRRGEGEVGDPIEVTVGTHQRDDVLKQAESASAALRVGEISPELKALLPELKEVKIGDKTYLGKTDSGALTKVFLGLDNNNEPIFFCATCQPSITGQTKDALADVTKSVVESKPVEFKVAKEAAQESTVSAGGSNFRIRMGADGKTQEIFHPQVGWMPATKQGDEWQVAYDQNGNGKIEGKERYTPLANVGSQHASQPVSIALADPNDVVKQAAASATARLGLPAGARIESRNP